MARLSGSFPPSPSMIHPRRIGSWGNSSRDKILSVNSPHEIILSAPPPINYGLLFQVNKRGEEASVNSISIIMEAVRDTT